MTRQADRHRNTKETRIDLSLDIDGSGQVEVSTGLPFFDHMLAQLAKHARFDLRLECDGDVEIDAHHTVEDVGITLGEALGEALGEKEGVRPFRSDNRSLGRSSSGSCPGFIRTTVLAL